LGYGGHFAAAGMTMLEQNVQEFSNKFEEIVVATINPDLLIPEIMIDAEISFKDITKAFYNIVQQMEPFGPENMRPVFVTHNVVDSGFSRVVKDNHLRFSLKQNNHAFTGFGFNLADKFPLLQQKIPIDVVYTIDMNEWNGEQSLQLRILDFNVSN
jgi:single-stranded-DNA-specific exonuclease